MMARFVMQVEQCRWYIQSIITPSKQHWTAMRVVGMRVTSHLQRDQNVAVTFYSWRHGSYQQGHCSACGELNKQLANHMVEM
jgi:hypothetical protein